MTIWRVTGVALACALVWAPVGAKAVPFSAESTDIVINDTAGSGVAQGLGAPFDSVVRLFTPIGGCTGSLISSTAVLTAKHCFNAESAAGVTVQFTNAQGIVQASRTASSVDVFGAFPALAPDGTDLAVVTLSSAVTGYTPLRLADSVTLRETVRMVGYGWNGVGSTGHGFSADGRRWAADNVIDGIGAAGNAAGQAIVGSANTISTDFDDGTAAANRLGGATFGSSATPVENEGTTAPGDSGGPLLVLRNGEWVIGGVLNGGTTSTSVFGDVSWWAGVSETDPRAFIEAGGGVYYVDDEIVVPLPAAAWMLLGGLLGLGVLRARSSRAS